ncbi:hypothetical protein CA984_07035 [Streptosporangium minutum]|uniref:Uncharacterized protein n=1 Tax=Streptosporangium minutum TaxID=569862 RepID=A0A243RTL9_9ACTN|nr:hypothetical protein CA984_07035 [Streptosporangium minutum]
MPARISVLQPPGQHDVQRRSGHHAELSGPGDGPRQPPPGHADPHPALDEEGRPGLRHVGLGPYRPRRAGRAPSPGRSRGRRGRRRSPAWRRPSGKRRSTRATGRGPRDAPRGGRR